MDSVTKFPFTEESSDKTECDELVTDDKKGNGQMKLSKRAKDLSGQRFGRLIAEEPVSSSRQGIIWRCRCDCGEYKDVPADSLLRKRTQSCGCLRRDWQEKHDITGHRFGRLVAVKLQYYNAKRQDYWLFHCDCGKEMVLPASKVRRGHVKNCGCLKRAFMEQLHRQNTEYSKNEYMQVKEFAGEDQVDLE